LRLGESAGRYELLEKALAVDSRNATAKTTCAVGGMRSPEGGQPSAWVVQGCQVAGHATRLMERNGALATLIG
jgi:hypothetical protein